MVHQYKNNGYNIVLDVNSGQIHLVDELVYDIIAMYENNDKQVIIDTLSNKYKDLSMITYLKVMRIDEATRRMQIAEAIDAVEELKAEGALFSEDIYEDYISEFKTREQLLRPYAYILPMIAI